MGINAFIIYIYICIPVHITRIIQIFFISNYAFLKNGLPLLLLVVLAPNLLLNTLIDLF